MMKKYDLQKAARNIMIPTNEIEVKYNLRELKQPICFFGEEAGDRRERYYKKPLFKFYTLNLLFLNIRN